MVNLHEHMERLVHELNEKQSLRSEWLREALMEVPRHLFIDQYYRRGQADCLVLVDQMALTEELLKDIYSDRGLMIRTPPNHSAASQPSLVTMMLHLLEAEEGHRVLEIGTGSGWNAGLLAFRLGDEGLVHSVDIQPGLIQAAGNHLRAAGFPGTNLLAADGGQGWLEKAPFDRIIVTVGCPDIPPAWCEQLAEGGIILLPFKVGGVGDPLLRMQKQAGHLRGRFVGWSGFSTLQGAFWADQQDPISCPGDPPVERLMSTETERMTVSAIPDIDCLMFAHLKGMRFRVVLDEEKRLGPIPVVYHPESKTLCIPHPGEPMITIHGEHSTGESLVAVIEEWVELGKPKLTDYAVELIGNVDAERWEKWVIKRTHATLGCSM